MAVDQDIDLWTDRVADQPHLAARIRQLTLPRNPRHRFEGDQLERGPTGLD